MRLALIALLTTAAGCAAPAGSGDPARQPGAVASDGSDDRQADGQQVDQAAAGRVAPSGDEAGGELAGAEPEVRAEAKAEVRVEAAPEGPPEWWHDEPVRRGGEVSVCAEAVAPALRAARERAIRSAYALLEEELGAAAGDASIGSEYEATQQGSDWRFRVRVTGSRQERQR